jgi:ATP-binding cassette, subfamily B, bacterial
MALARGLRRRAGDYLSTAGPLARLIWRAAPHLTLASAGFALAGGLLPVADIVIVSALLQALVDAGHVAREGGGSLPHFALLLVALAVVSLLTQLCERLAQLVTRLQSTRVTNQVQLLIAEKAASVDLSSFEEPTFHNEMRLVRNEAQHRALEVIIQLLSCVTILASLVSLSVILIMWHIWVVATLLLASAATLWASARFGSESVELTVGRAEAERTKHYLYNLLVSEQAAKEIRLFGLRDLLVGRFRLLMGTLYRQDRRLVVRQLAYSMPAGLVLAGTQVALVVFAAVEALHGVISVGRFNQYMLTIIQLGGQLPLLAFAVGSVHQGNLFAGRLFAFLATQPRVESAPCRQTTAASGSAAGRPVGTGPHIVFDRVCFAYPGTGRAVLTDVSFEVCPGQAIALAGSNGSGKSTIVKLLAGLYEPTAGSVSLNGTDIRTLDRAILRAQLSVVFQDFTVYHFAARENVGFGHVGFLHDDERIAAAARRSGLDQVISALPDGFDTVLGRFWDKGHELSGGQRQLVALARALLRQAPVLVLDEPSSALDARTEAEFFGRMLDDVETEPPRSVIFVSHRLSTARRADRIVVLKEGRVVEQGSHQQLMKTCGLYAEMFQLQSAAYGGGLEPAPGAVRGRTP